MSGPIYTIPPDIRIDEASVSSPDNLWHLPKDTWEKIWAETTGGGPNPVKIAVLDTGVSAHPDLPEPIATKSFIAGESIADGNGHGSHCSGTALGRNGIGVAPGAKLIAGKVLSNRGSGGSDGIAAGIRWAADQGADVISMSLGGGGPYEPTRNAILYALERGAVVVCAAGNAGYNGRDSIDYPGKYIEVICVGAIQQNGTIANFSSGGRRVDIATPGQQIISVSNRGSGYATMSGTSMATPFAAGLCALIIEQMRREGHMQMKGAEAWRKFFERWSEDRGDPGHDVRYGYGVPRSMDIVSALASKEFEWS